MVLEKGGNEVPDEGSNYADSNDESEDEHFHTYMLEGPDY